MLSGSSPSNMALFALALLPAKAFGAPALSTPNVQPRLANGLATTPMMGWNSYNHYDCFPNETIIHSNAQALVNLGLQAAGYHYVTVDCGWTLPNRTATGQLQPNPALFPSGYTALGEFIHGLNLGFGVYQDGGIQTCMTGTPIQAGSLGFETTDAKTFAAWGADLLKYDNCYSDAGQGYPDSAYAPDISPEPHYVTMNSALLATGRPMVFQICEWGVDFPSAWAPTLGNSWRIANDITGTWGTIPRILNQAVPQTNFGGPGRWLDLDMLQVGNDLFTTAEEQTHFSLWAILKTPLVIGAALKDATSSINEASLAILLNKDVIGYNQDSLGIAASFRRRWTEAGYEVWAGPLSGGRTVVALINLENVARTLTLDLPDVGFQTAASVKDIWNAKTTTNVITSYTASVAAHGTILLELNGTTAAGLYTDLKISTTTTTFSNVYAATSSSNYTAMLTFSSALAKGATVTVNGKTHTATTSSTTLSIPSLIIVAGNTNTLTVVSSIAPVSVTITAPPATFYPATSFTPAGIAAHTTCISGLCAPVGAKITDLASTGSASLAIAAPASLSSTTAAAKLTQIYFCNNDIAFDTAWTTGTNTRNMSISVNGVITRIEVPLSGRSSELFSPGLGWEDTGVFDVLLDGWVEGKNEVVVSNIFGVGGLVDWAPDFVGMGVLW